MSGDPAEDGPYSVSLSGQARRNIREHLPLEVAAAAMETIEGSIAVNPYRAGKPLDEPFDGFYSARRGTYRIVYRIDEAKHLAEIYSIRHRRDTYRSLRGRFASWIGLRSRDARLSSIRTPCNMCGYRLHGRPRRCSH